MTGAKPLIAVIDDDESVCRALQRLVRSWGMEAQTFRSGQAFIDQLREAPSRHLPVIFITAHDEVGVRERALAVGAVGVLRKPFDDEVFMRAVRAALAGRAHGPVNP